MSRAVLRALSRLAALKKFDYEKPIEVQVRETTWRFKPLEDSPTLEHGANLKHYELDMGPKVADFFAGVELTVEDKRSGYEVRLVWGSQIKPVVVYGLKVEEAVKEAILSVMPPSPEGGRFPAPARVIWVRTAEGRQFFNFKRDSTDFEMYRNGRGDKYPRGFSAETSKLYVYENMYAPDNRKVAVFVDVGGSGETPEFYIRMIKTKGFYHQVFEYSKQLEYAIGAGLDALFAPKENPNAPQRNLFGALSVLKQAGSFELGKPFTVVVQGDTWKFESGGLFKDTAGSTYGVYKAVAGPELFKGAALELSAWRDKYEAHLQWGEGYQTELAIERDADPEEAVIAAIESAIKSEPSLNEVRFPEPPKSVRVRSEQGAWTFRRTRESSHKEMYRNGHHFEPTGFHRGTSQYYCYEASSNSPTPELEIIVDMGGSKETAEYYVRIASKPGALHGKAGQLDSFGRGDKLEYAIGAALESGNTEEVRGQRNLFGALTVLKQARNFEFGKPFKVRDSRGNAWVFERYGEMSDPEETTDGFAEYISDDVVSPVSDVELFLEQDFKVFHAILDYQNKVYTAHHGSPEKVVAAVLNKAFPTDVLDTEKTGGVKRASTPRDKSFKVVDTLGNPWVFTRRDTDDSVEASTAYFVSDPLKSPIADVELEVEDRQGAYHVVLTYEGTEFRAHSLDMDVAVEMVLDEAFGDIFSGLETTEALLTKAGKYTVLNRLSAKLAGMNKLKTAGADTMPASVKKNIAKGLEPINEQSYFSRIPLKDIFKVLEDNGVVPLQEDGTEWSGMLSGGTDKTESVNMDLGWVATKDESGVYDPYKNSVLVMTHYKMPKPSGKYEVVVHVS